MLLDNKINQNANLADSGTIALFIKRVIELIPFELLELGDLLEILVEDVLVLGEEEVLEDALGLVQPALGDVSGLAAVELGPRHQQTLGDTRHVAQVELVEEFARSRTELGTSCPCSSNRAASCPWACPRTSGALAGRST